MTKLRKRKYALVVALLPYLLAANTALVVGSVCPAGPHFAQRGDSRVPFDHVSCLGEHHPDHGTTVSDEATVAAHCCACCASPVFERGVAEHAGSSTYASGQTSPSAHECFFPTVLGSETNRAATGLADERGMLGSVHACLRTTVLLI